MKYTRKWKSWFSQQIHLGKSCQKMTDEGWIVHTIVYSSHVEHEGNVRDGACIVAFKDEPDLTGGVPR